MTLQNTRERARRVGVRGGLIGGVGGKCSGCLALPGCLSSRPFDNLPGAEPPFLLTPPHTPSSMSCFLDWQAGELEGGCCLLENSHFSLHLHRIGAAKDVRTFPCTSSVVSRGDDTGQKIYLCDSLVLRIVSYCTENVLMLKIPPCASLKSSMFAHNFTPPRFARMKRLTLTCSYVSQESS